MVNYNMKRADNMKKEKIFKTINIILIITMSIGGILIGGYYLTINEYVRSFSGLSILITMLLPAIINQTKFKLTIQDTFFYYIFILLAHFLGSTVNLYQYISWFDTFTHFISGIVSFYAAYIILKRTKNLSKNKIINFLFFFGFISLVALSWEIIEYLADVIIKTNLQHNIETGVGDTMCDMIVATIGGIISYLYYLYKIKIKKIKE